jgi:hypothetical protein
VSPMPALRPYQLVAARAVLRAAVLREPASLSLEIARQGGKNEVSAQVEAALLLVHAARPVASVKCAPTFNPQALISLARLRDRLRDAGLGAAVSLEHSRAVRLGRARQFFLSAEPGSNVVGHTAGVLLEVDEAQDVDQEKFDKEFRPMAAAAAAPVVFYGTPWDDGCLLERAKQAHLESERRDGVRRHFRFDWQAVAEQSPEYGRFVEGERERLGKSHPLFLTQYCLETIPGAGRLLSPAQLSLLRGSHAWLDGPLAGDTYVAGLDVAGEAPAPGAAARHDSTVLTVARVVRPPAGAPSLAPGLEVVRVYVWTGEPHAAVQGALASLLAHTWRVARVCVDATGIGEPVAAWLRSALARAHVDAVKLSAETKSRLGFALLAAVNCGRLRLPGAGDAPDLRECWAQLRACRAVYRPNRTLNFFVDERDGHDDCVVSLALAVAAGEGAGPRPARGRPAEDYDPGGWT